VPLGHAADGWIAAHLRDQVEVHGDEGCFEAHARGGHCGFATGVPGAHNGYIVLLGKGHPSLFYGVLRSWQKMEGFRLVVLRSE
jgi:hypothetical protein